MNCSECGKVAWLLLEGNVCRQCAKKQKEAVQNHRNNLIASSHVEGIVPEVSGVLSVENEADENLAKAMSIMITTETNVNLNVRQRIDIVMATCFCPISMDVDEFKDDLFFRLKRAAVRVGANAVIGVNLSMISEVGASFGSANLNRYRAIAVGTAVLVDFEV